MADLDAVFADIVDGLRAHSRLLEAPVGAGIDAETAILTYHRGAIGFRDTLVLRERVSDYLLDHGHEIVDGW